MRRTLPLSIKMSGYILQAWSPEARDWMVAPTHHRHVVGRQRGEVELAFADDCAADAEIDVIAAHQVDDSLGKRILERDGYTWMLASEFRDRGWQHR
jgi:hypothetical protein